ncbi:hypothetical protein GXW78_16540 [Roseomonas terrae]|jgi:hypothetical protein|uniref:DUF4132 domain-containing protein n=1 Tax=Neoroseomonas terrae TaxID=424799 RepID=A0ABS5EKZ2_9PROT|nr:hypothetical protein [Neoroseomonas terrae]MBR0651282.1 hypothetical protein [Neoroseomonas terrae]
MNDDEYTRAYYEKNRPEREAIARRLDRQPFGRMLALKVWVELRRCKTGEGLIHQFHRDYCGHGLIRTADGVMLCEIQDGHFPGPPIETWRDRDAFVDFIARQSDWTCSGWERAEPVLYTDDPWRQSNQRLCRRILDSFDAPDDRARSDGGPSVEDIKALRDAAAAAIDRTPFGEKLSRKVWRELSWCDDGEVVMHKRERGYVGQSLLRDNGAVVLCEIEHSEVQGPPIASWHDRDEFITFLMRQSDWSCAGWDPAEPVFHLDAPWRHHLQRLTRAALKRFVPFW